MSHTQHGGQSRNTIVFSACGGNPWVGASPWSELWELHGSALNLSVQLSFLGLIFGELHATEFRFNIWD